MTGNEIISHNLEIIVQMTQNGASPPLDEYWEAIVDALTQDVETTRELLLKCSPEQIDQMGGYYEDVSERLQSQEFIDLLRELQQKYPDINMEQDIQWAIDAMT